MNKFLVAFLIGFIGFGFSSCDEDDVKGLLPDFDVNLKKVELIPVQVDKTNGEWVVFSKITSLDIINNQTKDYISKIKSLTINSLSYKIVNFAGDPIGKVDGSFAVANIISLQNAIVVKTEADNATIFQITDTNELNRIATLLKKGDPAEVKYSGSALCNDGDMNFSIEVTLDAKVTIDP